LWWVRAGFRRAVGLAAGGGGLAVAVRSVAATDSRRRLKLAGVTSSNDEVWVLGAR